MRPPAFVVLAAFTLGLACATGGSGAGEVGPDELLTAADIQADRTDWANTFEVVFKLRPEWLHPTQDFGFSEPGEVVTYLDGARLGGPAALQEIPAPIVMTIQYYDPVTARQRFGLDHRGGAIFVETR